MGPYLILHTQSLVLTLYPRLNVARMAELPDKVLKKAHEKSLELERVMQVRTLRRAEERAAQVIRAITSGEMGQEEVLTLCRQILETGGV